MLTFPIKQLSGSYSYVSSKFKVSLQDYNKLYSTDIFKSNFSDKHVPLASFPCSKLGRLHEEVYSTFRLFWEHQSAWRIPEWFVLQNVLVNEMKPENGHSTIKQLVDPCSLFTYYSLLIYSLLEDLPDWSEFWSVERI